MPICKTCEHDLPVEAFEAEPKMKSGHRNHCRKCRKRQKLDAYYRDRDRVLKEKREKYAADPTAERERCLAYYHATRDERLKVKAKHRQENPEQYRAWNQRRRAMRAGNGFEPYDRLDIFERDGWVCQLCHKGVDPTLEWPDPMARSIDHTIPVSKGGPDGPGNVRLTHLHCNLSRHDGRGDA
jgi:hypothetical protein